MSQWGALWALDAPIRSITNGLNPQGNVPAPVGTIAVRSCDGAVYVKRGGGSTAFGWYLFGSDQQINWQPRTTGGGAIMNVNGSSQTISIGATTIINALAQKVGAGSFDPKRQYVGGYTSAVVGNSWLARLTSNTDNMPSQRLDDSIAGNFLEFDTWWDVATTPRSNSAATSTTMADIRIWAGGGFGAAVVQAVGGTVSSDTLATEWPTMLSGTDGLFGWAFRFSTVAGDAGWQFVNTRRAGGAYAQTVTPMGVTCVGDTLYRLRVRYVFVAGVLTALASINDGAEIAVTTNMPSVLVPAQTMPFQPLASCRNIVGGVLKSLVVAQCNINYGLGVGAC